MHVVFFKLFNFWKLFNIDQDVLGMRQCASIYPLLYISNFILYFSGNSHEGDMGNLRQSNAGVIDAELTLPLMTLAGDLGIVGRAIVVSKPISFVLPSYKTQSYV